VAMLGVRGVAESATPVAAAAGAVVSWGEPLVAALVTVSTLAITQVLLMLAPRIYVAMADDGVFFRGIGQIHPKWHTPARAILLQALFAILHVFVAGSIGELLEVCSICDWVFFTICGATLFVLRRRLPDAPRPYRAWGYPWMPAIFLACSAAVLVRIAFSAQTLPALQATGLFAAGLVAYALWARRSPAPPGR
jgi:APA family basic amino acid/polyamine antiporter